jgi:hypothetical protein
MTTRNALRQAIASGRVREVKALLDNLQTAQTLRRYLDVPDDQLLAHLRRLNEELGAEHVQLEETTER